MAKLDLRRKRSVTRSQADTTPDTRRLMRYVSDGQAVRAPEDATVADGLRFAESAPSHMTMFFYPAPTPAAIAELAAAWELHPLLVEDLLHAKQRPKLERYGDVLFLVVRSARYIEDRQGADRASGLQR